MKNKLEGEYYCNVFVHPMDNWRHGEATSMKTTVLWDVVPCSLGRNWRTVSELLIGPIIRRMMEAVNISQNMVNFYETPQRNVPEDSQSSSTGGMRMFHCCTVTTRAVHRKMHLCLGIRAPVDRAKQHCETRGRRTQWEGRGSNE